MYSQTSFPYLSDELCVHSLYRYKKTHSMVMFLYSWFEIKDEMCLRMLFPVVMLLSNWFMICVLFSVLSDEFYVWKWCVYLYLFAMFDSSTNETVYWNHNNFHHNNFPIKFEKDQYTISSVYLMNLWSGQPILWGFNKFGIQKTNYTKSKFLIKEILLPLVKVQKSYSERPTDTDRHTHLSSLHLTNSCRILIIHTHPQYFSSIINWEFPSIFSSVNNFQVRQIRTNF